jgi:Protein of unknown function (DUF1257)
MSHFTTIKVQIKDAGVLREVLQGLGYVVEVDGQVRGYQGNTTVADFVIRRSNGYDIGFRRSDGDENYEVIADFWGTGINQRQFLNEVQQKYAHRMLMNTVERQGYSVEAEEVMEDGTVRVVVGRWV